MAAPLAVAALTLAAAGGGRAGPAAQIALPRPRLEGPLGVEQALERRRSVRAFQPAPLTLNEAAQLLWAAQGVTGPGGKRTAPSAGSVHPLTVYLAAGRVSGLAPGVWRYEPARHSLLLAAGRDARAALAGAAGQSWLAKAPAVFVLVADSRTMAARYGARAERFTDIEAGHAAENLQLQALALGLGGVDVGAFDAAKLSAVLGLDASQTPLLLLPVGRPAPQS